MYLLLWYFFIVNVYVFIPMMLFMVKNVKIGFLFSVNACVFIPMMLFIVKIFWKLLKIGIQGNGWLPICIYSNEKVFI